MATPALAPTTLDVSQVIDNSAIRPLHIALFALCLLCMIVDGFDVQALGYTAPAIIQEWGIAPALLGPVFGAGNFGVLVGQLSLAVLADRVGRRVWAKVGAGLRRTLDKGGADRTVSAVESCPSGRRSLIRNQVEVQASQGFESLALR